ncbi:AAA family ATPase [Salmonella enterica subsp. enterica serovar Corvallis]|nr:AAA family ATPase [Salmonella enterica subsp. enterica serovar Corvallis]
MIKDIHLKNFKCFESITLKQLKTLNVISGKNNFGKTSILDAIQTCPYVYRLGMAILGPHT